MQSTRRSATVTPTPDPTRLPAVYTSAARAAPRPRARRYVTQSVRLFVCLSASLCHSLILSFSFSISVRVCLSVFRPRATTSGRPLWSPVRLLSSLACRNPPPNPPNPHRLTPLAWHYIVTVSCDHMMDGRGARPLRQRSGLVHSHIVCVDASFLRLLKRTLAWRIDNFVQFSLCNVEFLRAQVISLV